MKSITVTSLFNGSLWLLIMLFLQLLFKFSDVWVWSTALLMTILTFPIMMFMKGESQGSTDEGK